MVILLLLFIAIISKIKKNDSSFRIPSFFLYVLILFFLGTISSILNQNGLVNYLFQLRNSLIYFLIPLALINLNLGNIFWKKIFKIIFFLYLLQIPISIIQFILFKGAGGETTAYGADYVFGSLSSLSALPLLSLVFFYIMASLYYEKVINLKYFMFGFLACSSNQSLPTKMLLMPINSFIKKKIIRKIFHVIAIHI